MRQLKPIRRQKAAAIENECNNEPMLGSWWWVLKIYYTNWMSDNEKLFMAMEKTSWEECDATN